MAAEQSGRRLLLSSPRVARAEFSNPQSNPQNLMPYMTSANLGSPRGLKSCCKIYSGYFDTVEVRSSSLLVPTIFLNGLATLASSREAPNDSIKHTELGRAGCPHFLEADFWTGTASGWPVIRAQSREPAPRSARICLCVDRGPHQEAKVVTW